MKKSTIASLIGLAFSTNIFAATNIQIDDVVVTATRMHENIQNIPSNVQVITRQDIQESNSTSITQTLNQLGGLTLRGTSLGQFNLGATVDIGSYGEAATSNTIILINGQPINPIDSSSVAWESIPIASIERIEITKGGAGVQYGNRAVGGAINIVTNENAENINRVSASYGSFNTQTLSALVQNRFDDTLVKISANTEHTNGWRDNSAATAYAANARATKFLGENSLYLDFSGSHRYSQNPGGVAGVVGQGNNHQAKFNNVGSFFEGENYGITFGGLLQLASGAELETDLTYKTAKLSYDEPYSSMYNAYNRWSLTFSPRLKVDFNSWGNLVTGYDFSHAYGKDNQLSNAGLIDNSLYAIYRLPLIGGLELNTGYRRQIESTKTHDGNAIIGYDAFFNPITGSLDASKTTSANAWDAGLNYKFAQQQKLYVKYNQSFRFPNIDEFWGFDPVSYNTIFNGANLKPQLDKTYQVGGDFLLGTTKVIASLYHTNTSKQIRYDSFADSNINDPNLIERKGVYLSTISSVSDKLTLYTNSNLQDVSYTEGPNDNQSLPLAPHLTINGRINYKIDENWAVGSVINYVGSQYYVGAHDLYNNRNVFPAITSISNFYNKIPSYTVTDIYTSYKSGKWDARVTLKNVANAHYATYGGMGFVTLPTGSGWSYYYYPSDPRSVFASVSYSF